MTAAAIRRRFFLCAFVALAFLAGPSVAGADVVAHDVGHGRITVTADTVRYYADDAIVWGSGGAKTTLPDGTTATGDVFAMDLHAHRIELAGHVSFSTPAGIFTGAALSMNLSFGRTYFVPLVPAADRWTFFGSDYAHPARGRDMPGDVFVLPDVSAKRPYVAGKSALIDASTFVQIEPATTAVLGGPDTPPLPSFADNYSSNPAFGENALPGATFDAPYPFYGTGNSLEALHVRYDQNRADPYFLSFEHHAVADDGAYAVISLNPLTQPDKQWTLVGYLPEGPVHAFSASAQLFTVQDGLAQPSSSNGFVDWQYTSAWRQSSLTLDATQAYDSLLTGSGPPDHPFIIGVSWNGYQHELFRSGFTYRVTTGAAWERDRDGISGTGEDDLHTSFAGLTMGTPQVAGPFGSSLYGTASLEHTWLSFPDAVTTQTFVASDSAQLAKRVYGVLSDTFGSVRTDDPALAFASVNVATGLVPSLASPNGLPAFGTITTSPRIADRAYAYTLSWQPNSSLQFGTTTSRSDYSPAQTFPPWATTIGVRANVGRDLFLTAGRTYFYQWFGQGWSPRFTFQVSGQ